MSSSGRDYDERGLYLTISKGDYEADFGLPELPYVENTSDLIYGDRADKIILANTKSDHGEWEILEIDYQPYINEKKVQVYFQSYTLYVIVVRDRAFRDYILYHSGRHIQRNVVGYVEIIEIGKDVGIYYIQYIDQNGRYNGVISETAEFVPVPYHIVERYGAVVIVSCSNCIYIHVLISLVLLLVECPAIARDCKSSIKNGNFPIIPVICLTEAGEQRGV